MLSESCCFSHNHFPITLLLTLDALPIGTVSFQAAGDSWYTQVALRHRYLFIPPHYFYVSVYILQPFGSTVLAQLFTVFSPLILFVLYFGDLNIA